MHATPITCHEAFVRAAAAMASKFCWWATFVVARCLWHVAAGARLRATPTTCHKAFLRAAAAMASKVHWWATFVVARCLGGVHRGTAATERRWA